MRKSLPILSVVALLSSLSLLPNALSDQPTAEVEARISIAYANSPKGIQRKPQPPVVLWLSPLRSDANELRHPIPTVHYRMAQKNKQFDPQFLVVPIGSTVEFPNLDPFFHNVFSQFNGKRFDLGLYETGSTKGVQFDHEGVSYIFCNIHPEMAAVIVTLATPYYSVSSSNGAVEVHRVPVGNYEMHVWAEGADPKELEALTRRVSVGPAQNDLGSIQIVTHGTAVAHKNKFGDDYRPEQPTTY